MFEVVATVLALLGAAIIAFFWFDLDSTWRTIRERRRERR